jgi:hypothetical protein
MLGTERRDGRVPVTRDGTRDRLLPGGLGTGAVSIPIPRLPIPSFRLAGFDLGFAFVLLRVLVEEVAAFDFAKKANRNELVAKPSALGPSPSERHGDEFRLEEAVGRFVVPQEGERMNPVAARLVTGRHELRVRVDGDVDFGENHEEKSLKE